MDKRKRTSCIDLRQKTVQKEKCINTIQTEKQMTSEGNRQFTSSKKNGQVDEKRRTSVFRNDSPNPAVKTKNDAKSKIANHERNWADQESPTSGRDKKTYVSRSANGCTEVVTRLTKGIH